MKRELQAGILSICCIFIVYFISSVEFNHTANNPGPRAIAGVLDLSKLELSNTIPITLDGEWDYYEGLFLSSGKNLLEDNKAIVQVPKQWNNYAVGRVKPRSYGYGTYHLRILFGEQTVSRIIGMKIENVGMSNSLFVNGVKIGESGKPGEKRSNYKMSNVPYTAYFSNKDKQIDIYMQVANYDYTPYGGIVSSIYFGTQKAIERSYIHKIVLESVLASCCFILGLFFVVVAFYRRRLTYVFYFSMYNFSGMIFTLTHGEKLWYHMFPSFDYALFSKLQFFSAGLYVTFFLLFLYTSFPFIFHNRITKVAIILSCLFYPVVLFPLSIQSDFSMYQMIFIQVASIYSVYGFIQGILSSQKYSIPLAFGSIISLLIVIDSVRIVMGYNKYALPVVILQLIWTLIHASLTSVRLSKAFSLSELRERELIKMNQNKNEFLAKTSHEFKTPLHGIVNIIKLLLEKESKYLPKNEVKDLELVVDIANRLSRLVNDILDISRVQDGKYVLNIQSIGLKEHLSNVITVSEFVYGTPHCHIYVDAIEPDVTISADPDRFKQIMYNLIENAIKYSDKGIVHINIRKRETTVEISVVDSGKGIEKNRLDDIFKNYIRLDHQMISEYDGVGLGLSIVRSLVEQMNGRIWVESEVEKGASFTVAFLLTNELTAPSFVAEEDIGNMGIENYEHLNVEETEIQYHNPDGEATVLVVDDNSENLKVLIDTLVSVNYHVIATKSGKAALQVIDQGKVIDLVILDVMMHELSGYDVSIRIRERYSIVDLPILFLTAAFNIIDSDIAIQYGANDFLYKPYQLSELRARVKSLIMMRKSALQKAQYEIAFLHAQIKPHFLYNALNTIAASCEDILPETADLIVSLAKYLRGTLDFANISNLVPIDKELVLVKSYLSIEQARFPELSVKFDVDDDVLIQLPPLSIQLLVENAVKHGAMSKKEVSEIMVIVKRYGEMISVTVWDNGMGLSKERFESVVSTPKNGAGIGLYNLNQRLIKMRGSRLQLFNVGGVGTTIGFEVSEWSNE